MVNNNVGSHRNFNAAQSVVSSQLDAMNSRVASARTQRIKAADSVTSGLDLPDRTGTAKQDLQNSMQQIQNASSYTSTQSQYLIRLRDQVAKSINLVNNTKQEGAGEAERAAATAQIQETVDYLNTLVSKDFNGIGLFNGARGTSTVANTPTAKQLVTIDLTQGDYAALTKDLSVQTPEQTATTLTALDKVLTQVQSDQNRLVGNEFQLQLDKAPVMEQLFNFAMNSGAISSQDEADKATAAVKQQILLQSGMSALAQANASSQMVLQLLR